VLIGLAGLILLWLFTREIANPDFWWQLKTGEYIAQTHALPDPDPFAFTTAGAGQAYPGEATVRHFNLTHEWLAQVLFYLVYRVGGFGGVVLARAAILLAFCGLVGLIAYRRSGHFYRALAATLVAGAMVAQFAADRPNLITFVLLAATLAILEWRHTRWIWLLPAVMLVWANSHGGFFLGWIAMAAWSAEALYQRLRGRPVAGDVQLWTVSAVAVAASLANPNGFQVITVLLDYRQSFLTSRLVEWQPATLWPPSGFSLLLVAAALLLLFRLRRVRLSDWLLFLTFATAGILARRNEFLVGLEAPILLAVYLPGRAGSSRLAPRTLAASAGLALVAILVGVVVTTPGMQLRAAEWAVPAGPANFLLANHITQPMLNTYEDGGYLIWKLWPQQRVFLDGRALSEAVFNDNQRMLNNAGNQDGGKSVAQLLEQYGIGVVVMSPFEYVSGVLYMLAPALDAMDWKLVYAAADGMVFLRHAPDGMAALDGSWIREAMDAGCRSHIEHDPTQVACAYNLGHTFLAAGETENAIRWLGIYLEHAPASDPKVKAEYQKLLADRK
jgi:hypothetical protein